MIPRLAVCVFLFVACLRPDPLDPTAPGAVSPASQPRGGAADSKAMRGAAYFSRVREQVEDHWHPADIFRQRDPTGSIHGRGSRPTLVRVRLQPDGNLVSVAVEQPSGLEFLDELAIAAFQAAQPFPPPPPDLVDASDGHITFTFRFLFDPGGGAGATGRGGTTGQGGTAAAGGNGTARSGGAAGAGG